MTNNVHFSRTTPLKPVTKLLSYGRTNKRDKGVSAVCLWLYSVFFLSPSLTHTHTHTDTQTHTFLNLCLVSGLLMRGSLSIQLRCSRAWPHTHTHTAVPRVPFSLRPLMSDWRHARGWRNSGNWTETETGQHTYRRTLHTHAHTQKQSSPFHSISCGGFHQCRHNGPGQQLNSPITTAVAEHAAPHKGAFAQDVFLHSGCTFFLIVGLCTCASYRTFLLLHHVLEFQNLVAWVLNYEDAMVQS